MTPPTPHVRRDSQMRNINEWKPTKFDLVRGVLRGGFSPQLATRSRCIADLMAKSYQRALVKHARGRLVDLGSGCAPLYGVYGPLADQVICVDWPKSLHGSKYTDIAADLAEGMPFRSEVFDTVVATDVLEHLKDSSTFWSEVSRTMAPGGKLVLGVPFLYWLHEEPHDYFRYTRHALAAACGKYGLEIDTLEEYAGPIAVILDCIGKNMPGENMAALFQSFARWLMRRDAVRQLDLRRAGRFPAGYCLVASKPAN